VAVVRWLDGDNGRPERIGRHLSQSACQQSAARLRGSYSAEMMARFAVATAFAVAVVVHTAH